MPRRKFKNTSAKRAVKKLDLSKLNIDPIQSLGQRSIVVENSQLFPSFKQMLKNEKNVENPNILSPKELSEFKNKSSSIEKKFDSENDPIYDLDEAPNKLNTMSSNPVLEYYSNFIEEEISKGTKRSTIRKNKVEKKNAY
jgi:hypothetical protein